MTRRDGMDSITRRGFLRSAAALAALPVAGPLASLNSVQDHPRSNSVSSGLTAPIDHIVILMQENRSLDHYLGFVPGLLSPRPARGHQLPDAQGKTWDPYHLDYVCGFDPDHEWRGSHDKWDSGRMDGFVRADGGSWPMGYYERSDHPYHADLAQAFGLGDAYFCSLIGPTTPNRLFLWTGSSGGLRANPDPAKPASLSLMNWPTVVDILDAKGVSWACYSVADGSVPSPIGAFNPLVFFPKRLADPRTLLDINLFLAQAATGTLPKVSWIITEAVVCEHPPAPPDLGQALVARVVQALMSGPRWNRTVLFVTYDEGGGFWDHVAPPILEHDIPADHPWVTPDMRTAFKNDGQPVGPAFRVPLIAVSPFVPPGTVFHDPADHTSIIRFLEWRFGLDPMPTIAPGRRSGLTNLVSLFDFAHPDLSSRGLPTTVDVHRALVECPTTIPRWLPPLIGPVGEPYPEPPPAVGGGGPSGVGGAGTGSVAGAGTGNGLPNTIAGVGTAGPSAAVAGIALATMVASRVRTMRHIHGLGDLDRPSLGDREATVSDNP